MTRVSCHLWTVVNAVLLPIDFLSFGALGWHLRYFFCGLLFEREREVSKALFLQQSKSLACNMQEGGVTGILLKDELQGFMLLPSVTYPSSTQKK